MNKLQKEWSEGNRAFYWNENIPYIKHPLCLQSKQYNSGTGVTWVYYSKADAKRLYKFLKEIFEESASICPECCPNCGGPADNGNDRCVPPNAYNCTKCTEAVGHEGEGKLSPDQELYRGSSV